jgi:tRNA threonylcarbamoyladenosine biosynthesis protein TsaE
MKSARTYEIITESPDDTKLFAQRLSHLLQGREVIELVSDLGGGKTTFTQGLAAGLGFKGPVTSPTFTLSQIYQLPGQRELHHYDLYRLGEAGVVGFELGEDIGQEGIITVIEWGAVARDIMPADRLTITFNVTAENARQLVLTAGGPVSNHILTELSS